METRSRSRSLELPETRSRSRSVEPPIRLPPRSPVVSRSKLLSEPMTMPSRPLKLPMMTMHMPRRPRRSTPRSEHVLVLLSKKESEQERDYKMALELGKVLVAYARLMLVGPGGVGKSSLLHGLMNLPLPLANSTQLADLLTVRPQTDIDQINRAEQQTSTNQIWAKAADDEKPWQRVTDDDEINELVGLVLLVSNVSQGLTKSSRFQEIGQGAATYAVGQLYSGIVKGVSDEYREQVSSVKDKVVCDVLSRAIKLANKDPHAQAPDTEIRVRVWDCGGQTVYLDILSAFLTPKTLFMLMYDARKSLNDRCITLSHQDGKVTQQKLQCFSYLELLSRWMASIHVTLTDIKSSSIPDYPHIITVGTHGDDINVNAHKNEIIETLMSVCDDKAFTHLGNGFIVNNKSAGKGENEDPTFKELRKEVHKFASQPSVTIATPVAWVLFRKVLDKVAETKPVLTYEEALEVAVACSIPPHTFKSVLKFYHDVAVFLYYEHISSMKGYVIASPEWLMKQLAKLLALEGFEEVHNRALWKPLRENGILVEPLFKKIWRHSSLPVEAIMDLLEKCLLATPIDTKQRIHGFSGIEYFVPSALPLCSDDELNHLPHDAITRTASLHLLFSTGYVPPGCFTRLVIALSKENKCHISFSHRIYYNRVTFLFGDENNKIDEVTIIQHVESIEIIVNRSIERNSHNLPFSLACHEVMNIVLTCSSNVREWLPSIKVCTAFLCEACQKSKDHFNEIPAGATTQSKLRCQNGKICTLSPAEQYWLTISPKEEALDLPGFISRAELQAVAQEVQADKFKELADSMEMSIHISSSVQGAELLDRWQKEMKQFDIHCRSHLVHHLRCVNLADTAHRLKYNQLQIPQEPPAILPQGPLSKNDLLRASRLMGDGDLEMLSCALGVSDDDLASIQSRFKKTEGQAFQILCRWHSETNASNETLRDILTTSGYTEAAKSLQVNDTPSLTQLLQRVKTTKWFRLGLELGIDHYTMQTIEADCRHESNMTALTRVFIEWLKTENPVWKDVEKALKVMGEKLPT